jgi:acetolactate decarboxylase
MGRSLFLFSFLLFSFSCQEQPSASSASSSSALQMVGAMKNVMWKGELDGIINLDTISDQNGLYGIGPLAGLRGELLINDGQAYVSRVTADSSMTVEKNFDVSAPFFVYANVTDWEEVELPNETFDLQTIQDYIHDLNWRNNEPYTFKLIGTVQAAEIHIQNLAPGSVVSSPKEAHAGQVGYELENEEVEMVGFFSTTHQGVFVHHDAYTHIHLVTKDEQQMGHLDGVMFEGSEMTLYLGK